MTHQANHRKSYPMDGISQVRPGSRPGQSSWWLVPLLVLGGPAACMRMADEAAPTSTVPAQPLAEVERRAKSMEEKKEKEKPMVAPAILASLAAPAAQAMADELKNEEPPAAPGPAEAEPPPATRSWFPETFLFEPLVETDDQGAAQVPVRVPDRLTEWRVLGLAHARNGTQTGAEVRFASSLPAYVDPVLPPFLTQGDRVVLPLLVVNTTAAPLQRQLTVRVQGAAEGELITELRLPAGGSLVREVTVHATRAGTAEFRAMLAGADALVRTLPVQPAGRPEFRQVSGMLASPRPLTLTGPANLDPASARARLLVFPGPLALLRAELLAAPQRAGVSEDAYGLLLAGRAPTLLAALGSDPPEPEALRQLILLETQRVVRHARTPELAEAVLLAEAALAHPDQPILARAGERLAQEVADGQLPDGSFGRSEGWTLQRLLVLTAEAVRAVRAAAATSDQARFRAERARIRARAFFERNLARVEDPYTAAALVASGSLPEERVEQLRARIREALQARPDGSRVLVAGPGVVRSDGQPPGVPEATALAALALQGDPAAPWITELGSALLAGFTPAQGWGDGRANLAALTALTQLFRDPLPERVEVSLTFEARPLATGLLEPKKLKDFLVLEADVPEAAGPHAWAVQARPGVPGLGFSLTLQTWVPWEQTPAQSGLELELAVPQPLAVGQATLLTLKAAAPAGLSLVLRQPLPAGVQADLPGLTALQQAGQLTRFAVEDGLVTLWLAPLAAGQPFQAQLRVIPTLAGSLRAAAASLALVEPPGTTLYCPVPTWEIRAAPTR